MSKNLFELGSIAATPAALDFLAQHYVLPEDLLERHSKGDWGDIDDDDKQENAAALRDGERLFSAYVVAGDEKVYVITESDRSYTTIILPSEY